MTTSKTSPVALQDVAIAQAHHMVNMLAPDGNGLTFQTFDENQDRVKPLSARTFHGSLSTHKDKLEQLNQKGAGIFLTVNQTDGNGRKKDNITAVRAIVADFDKADPERLDRLLDLPLAPSLVVESSKDKHHAYWIANGIPLDKFTEYQKRLISYFNEQGDEPDKAVNDLPRVMRLAGFNHCKVNSKKGLTGEPFISSIKHTGTRYNLDDIEKFIDIMPASDLQIIKPINNTDNDLGDFTEIISGESEEDILNLLDSLDPSIPYDDWLRVGQCIHNEQPVAGLALFETWSKGGNNYTEGVTAQKWKSFKIGGGVTFGTLRRMANIADSENSKKVTTKLIDEINNADEMAFRTDIIPKIKKAKLDDFDRTKLVKAYQDKAKELTGIKPPIAEVRRDLASNDSTANLPEFDANNRPKWTYDWVYNPSLDSYINIEKLTPIGSNGFNIINGKHIPYNDGGTKPNATKYVADRGILEVVDAMEYLPTHDEFICQIGNQTVVNTFNKKSVPTEDEKFTDEGLVAIELVKKHIKFVFTTDEDAAIFTQWLAHQVQFTGKLIMWAPLIQSIQGVGKSYFAKLLRLVLGVQNVGVVSPTQVTSAFNSWAYGKVVNVLDEIKIDGHNRYEAVNALKPLVTDDRIQINSKGLPQFEVTNVTNYICFTNHKDAIPTGENDRRWWKISCEIESLEDLPQWVGESENTYYKKLHRATDANGGQLRKWLLEYHITDEFKAIKRAPETEAKRASHATEEAGVFGLLEVKDLLETGGEFFNKECVSIPDLFKQLNFINPDLNIQHMEVVRILKRLNYQANDDKQIMINGRRKRFWTKRTMAPEQIKDSLDKTAPNRAKSDKDYFA